MSLYKIHSIGALCLLMFNAFAIGESKPDVYVVIHGTWSSPRHWLLHKTPQWHQEGNASFDALKKESHAVVIAHTWSGKNHVDDRLEGARTLVIELKKLAQTHTIHIVAHSHGGNVALLALGFLAEEQSPIRIEKVVLLGTPIHLEWYEGCFHMANNVYNIFSYGDVIQSVAGMYERLLPEQAHIFNIQIKLNDSCPAHNSLHHQEIMRQIPHLNKLFAKKDDYCLHCKDGRKPVITQDTSRKQDIAVDKKFTQQLLDSWVDIREKYADTAQDTHDRLTRFRHRWSEYYKNTVARLYAAIGSQEA